MASNTGRTLNRDWGVNAHHALYRENGTWYHLLERFPGALFDKNGYIVFETEANYRKCSGVFIGKKKNWMNVPKGIASLPGYVRAELARPAHLKPSIEIPASGVNPDTPPDLLDIPRAGTEGHKRLVSHMRIERDRSLVERKKRAVLEARGSLACEVCKFDFSVYRNLGEEFCEVHHLLPLSRANAEVRTSLSDLAVVCANCHRMIHRGGQSRSLSKVRASLRFLPAAPGIPTKR